MTADEKTQGPASNGAGLGVLGGPSQNAQGDGPKNADSGSAKTDEGGRTNTAKQANAKGEGEGGPSKPPKRALAKGKGVPTKPSKADTDKKQGGASKTPNSPVKKQGAAPTAPAHATPKRQGGAKKPAARVANGNNWRRALQVTPIKDHRGNPIGWRTRPHALNVALILTHHPLWKDVIGFDEFAERIVKLKRLPPISSLPGMVGEPGPWTDQDTVHVMNWLQACENVELPDSKIAAAVVTAARQRSRHPVQEYLNGLIWDGTKRLETVLIDYFGAVDTEYVRAVTRMWFISAVARVMEPGVQADYALILEGEQGVGKSQALRSLVPEKYWYSETGINLGHKDSYQSLHGVWIYCLDEMASVHGADVRTMKNFLTSPADHYRASYGRIPQTVPRQNVFACTVNPEPGGYFGDRTGNRRFWPIVTGALKPGIVKVRDQIWAEARKLYGKKMPSEQRPQASRWWPDAAMMKLCAEQQGKRLMPEPWVDVVRGWIAAGAPKRDAYGNFSQQQGKVNVARGLSTNEALTHAIGLKPEQLHAGPAMRMGRVFKELGYHLPKDGARVTHDGVRDRYYLPGAPVLEVVDGQKVGK